MPRAALLLTLLALALPLTTGAIANERSPLRSDSPGRLDPELASLYQSTGRNPFDAVSANNLAMKLMARGDYEPARKLLRRAVRLSPERIEFTRNLEQVQALIVQRSQLPERSRRHYQDSFAVVEVPFVADPWIVEGPGRIGAATRDSADVAGGGTDDPHVEGRATSRENPFDTAWLRERAAVKERRGDYRAALLDLRRTLVLDPYLSQVARDIDRLERLLPSGGESVYRPATPNGQRSARSRPSAGELPARWQDALPQAKEDEE